LAIKIAQSGPFEIVNGDAMQIYQEIPIITAQPTKEERGTIHHHLFGYKMGDQPCSVADWLNDAQQTIKAIHSRGNIPIVVGGSGLYFKALTDGLSSIPPIDDQIRMQTRALFDEIGKDEFYKQLISIDSQITDKIKAGDSQRMIRAFEVVKQTGKSIADWHKEEKLAKPRTYDFLQIQLDIPRNILHEKINKRFLLMFENGALEEAKYIMNKYYGKSFSINKAHGIPELIQYLKGELSKEKAIDKAQTITRQYAKRQVTWLKHQTDHLSKIVYKNISDLPLVLNFI
jgi:tRNA dimethylallyltransferase